MSASHPDDSGNLQISTSGYTVGGITLAAVGICLIIAGFRMMPPEYSIHWLNSVCSWILSVFALAGAFYLLLKRDPDGTD